MTNTDEKQSAILKALADENRIRLLRLLACEVLNVQELCEILDLPQSRASRHLSVLRTVGLVHDQREGSRVYYSLAKLDDEFQLIAGYIEGIAKQEHPDLERMQAVLRKRTRASQDFAEEQAGRWDQLGSELYSGTAALLAIAQLTKSDRITADLGTGTGLLLPLLGGISGKVYAIDHSNEMLSHARQRCSEQQVGNVDFLCADLDALDTVMPEPCDCILMHFVLHQLARPRHVVQTVTRCLKTQGNLVLVDRVKHEDETSREKFGSLWLGFEESAVRDWFQSAGLSDIIYHKLTPDPATNPEGIFVAAASLP